MAEAKYTAKDLGYKHLADLNLLVQILAIKDTNLWSKQFMQ